MIYESNIRVVVHINFSMCLSVVVISRSHHHPFIFVNEQEISWLFIIILELFEVEYYNSHINFIYLIL
jgi:hypothetical protein